MNLKVAVIQLNSRDHASENMSTVEAQLERAAATGAQLLTLPELWTYLGPYSGYDQAAQTLTGPAIEMLQEKARKYKISIHGGSILVKHERLPGKFYNTSLLINPNGEIVATYHKIHLFDVELADGDKHHESERIVAGDSIVTASIDGITFGLSVCYDLRFPELYRALKLQGAQVILIPAAFTSYTGRAHWEVLVRARAIENQCYIIAPGQVGPYPPDKSNFGHSMIVDPWGTVLAQAEEDVPTIISADLDLGQIERVARQIPCLEHRKPQVYAS